MLHCNSAFRCHDRADFRYRRTFARAWRAARTHNFSDDMTDTLAALFANNLRWSERIRRRDPGFFDRLAHQQAPEYLWIGCSDSRVPANEIIGLAPGEVFVHRNVGNVVAQTDLNCLSVIEFAVDLLRVKHIIVVGHYGCSGVKTVLEGRRVGLADNWLRQIGDVNLRHADLLGAVDPAQRLDRLCELNVIEQVVNVCRTTVMQDAWLRGQPVTVHGWVYGLQDGLARDLKVSVDAHDAWLPGYRRALAAIAAGR
jgi:carbonic anhydrase